MKRTLLALAVLASAATAQADNRQGWYVGGGPGYIDTGISSNDGGSVSVSAIELFGGYKLNPYVGGELRLGTGLSGDNGVASGTAYDFDLTHSFAAYYRVESANQVAKLYGLLGFSSVGWDTETDAGVVNSTSELGFSYGAGIGFVVGPRGNLNFEYRTLLSSGDFEFDIISASYDYRF